MAKSAVDSAEQVQLATFLATLLAHVRGQGQLAEAVTFWRHHLLVGLEPSQVPELLAVLLAVAALPGVGHEVRTGVRHWHAVLEPRALWPAPSPRAGR